MTAESIHKLVDFDDGLSFAPSVDCIGLNSTITTLREGSDYRLGPTVSRLRESLEMGEIAKMQWISGVENLADSLIKRTKATLPKLNDAVTTGMLSAETLKKIKRAKID